MPQCSFDISGRYNAQPEKYEKVKADVPQSPDRSPRPGNPAGYFALLSGDRRTLPSGRCEKSDRLPAKSRGTVDREVRFGLSTRSKAGAGTSEKIGKATASARIL